MKEPVNFLKQPCVETFCKILSETFGGAIAAITSKPADTPYTEVYMSDADTMFEAFSNETFVSATESNTDFETGLFFRTRDITMLADFMLAGDGESSDELSDDIIDAVKELASQLLSSVNVPVEDTLKKKFSLKVDDVAKNISSAVFQASEYLVIDFAGEVGERKVNFRLFMDGALAAYLKASEEPEADESSSFSTDSFFQTSAPAAAPVAGTQNLDLLLDIDIPVSVRMGSAKLFLKDILGLGPGNIVELEQNADDSIELAINDKVIARGEVVIVDGYFGFRIKEIVSKAERIKKLKD